MLLFQYLNRQTRHVIQLIMRSIFSLICNSLELLDVFVGKAKCQM